MNSLMYVSAVIRSITQLEKMKQDVDEFSPICNANTKAQLAYAEALVQLLKQQDKDYHEQQSKELTPDEKNLLFQGPKGKIPLIKALRERKGLGLLEAKLLVEKLHEENGIASSPGNYLYPYNTPKYQVQGHLPPG